MKKHLLILTLILMFVLNVKVFSTCEPMNGPCPNDAYQWSQAKYLTICGGEYGMTACSSSCCFVMEYYDRVHTESGEKKYDVSITNIFFPTDGNCANCISLDLLTGLLYDKLMDLNYQRYSFRDSVDWQPNSTNYENVYTPKACKDVNSKQSCSTIMSCCTTVVGIDIDDSEYGYVGFYNVFYNNDDKGQCPYNQDEDCHQFCYGFNWALTQSFLPCSQIICNRNWTLRYTSYIMDPYCNGCTIQVFYRVSSNSCPPGTETFDDIEIDSIINVGGCGNCDYRALYQFAEQQVLINEGHYLSLYECKTHYRILESKCWHRQYNDEMVIQKWVHCPNLTGCCWTRYKVCRTSENWVTVEFMEQCGEDVTCQTVSAPDICASICGTNASGQGWRIALPEEDLSIKSNQTNSYVIPNPFADNCEIHVFSIEKGLVNLDIYDILGNIVYSDSKAANGKELIFKIDNSDFPVGVYYYNISINNHSLSNGFLNIIR